MASRLLLERAGVRLACLDFGGDGPPVLLLHGLAGHAGEWAETAAWMTDRARVVALDARGHGHSERALAGWPVPFASREDAVEFFGGPSLSAERWADGLEHRDGGWWPRFEVAVMARTLREATGRPSWEEWEAIRCPTLVVRAGAGTLSPADAEAMIARQAHARLVELADAEHDLHLDRPLEWRRAVSDFLDDLDRAPGA